ncbi:MAG: sulfur carrier protein ThiS [Bacteroidota bacterium]
MNHNKEVYEAEKMTISEIMKAKNYTFNDLIIKINGTLILDEEWGKIVINDGDNLEIIHIFHGG